MTHDETICAIATPPGEGGIGVVRVSGPNAVAIADRVCRLRNGRSLTQAPSHCLQLGEIVSTSEGDAPSPDRRSTESARIRRKPVPLETALVVVMRAPRSYTGEDVVEFQCHSGPIVLRRTCEVLLGAGARLAEPGEFTKRAFLNGRLDLTQAEGVLDTIRARTEESLRVAHELTRGALSSEVNRLQETLTSLLAQIEAGIDFVEEDITFVAQSQVVEKIGCMHDALSKLLSTWESGRLLRQGAKVVILGKPNVGKSSLLNALVKFDRAIVTSVPGTTRDLLEEGINLEGIPIRVVDTAGVRKTDDPVEIEGVRRTHEVIPDADLALIVIDVSTPLEEEDRSILVRTQATRRVMILNKIDQPDRLSSDDYRELRVAGPEVPIIRMSALTGLGLEALRSGIIAALPHALEAGDGPTVSRLRHRESIAQARDALLHALHASQGRLSGEFLAVDLRVAVTALGELTGAVTTDDLLNRIFSEFCIGK